MNVGQKQGQSLKQSQRLIMSPQMQQAIHLLQLPLMELTTAIEAEMAQNPTLEYSSEDSSEGSELQQLEREIEEVSLDGDFREEREISFSDKDFEIMKHLDEHFRDHFSQSEGGNSKKTQDDEKLKTFMESSIQEESTLFDILMKQAVETFEDKKELHVAEILIGHLDERGFLTTSLEEIAQLNSLEIRTLEEVLDDIQHFEPQGIGARNLQESLLIQLRLQGKKQSLSYKIIANHYEDLLHNRIPLIQKSLNCSAQEIRSAVRTAIAKLDLQPGAWHVRTQTQTINADVSVCHDGEKLVVDICDDRLPSLRLNPCYLRMMENPDIPAETRDYLKQKVMSSKWLLKNLHQRSDTILRIAQYLVTHQEEFFLQDEGKLKPMVMKTVADALQLHESTIARAVSNKYLGCQRGLIPLRSFFTNAYVTQEGEDISANTVRDALSTIIKSEDKRRPFSDEALSKLLSEKGIECARRTVAKYRQELCIGNASQRRLYV